MAKQRVTVRVGKNTADLLKRVATKDGKSLSGLVDELLELGMQKLKEDPQYLLK